MMQTQLSMSSPLHLPFPLQAFRQGMGLSRVSRSTHVFCAGSAKGQVCYQ